MTKSAELHPLLQGIDINDYNIETIDDEIRVDQLSVDLLRHLYQHLTRHEGIPAEQAGKSCRSRPANLTRLDRQTFPPNNMQRIIIRELRYSIRL